MDKVIVIGAVESTKSLLLKLIEHRINVVTVFGYMPSDVNNVSGYVSFENICRDNEIPFVSFIDINDDANFELLSSIKPDIIFAVGFSQLIKQKILDIPSKGVIGFHPTLLPKGRGRAPIAWTILNEELGAANFFLMGKGTDDGPIFVQEKFEVFKDDDAGDVMTKIKQAIDKALDVWLPKLKEGSWAPVEQDHTNATEYARRAPLDGLINWSNSSLYINRLIKASARPHPGAFTFYDDFKILVWKCRIEEELKITGVIGRIVKKKDNELLVQTGEGLLWLSEYEIVDCNGEVVDCDKLVVGSRLGYYEQNEIFKLRNELRVLKNIVYELKRDK